jgi:hypothetical protein
MNVRPLYLILFAFCAFSCSRENRSEVVLHSLNIGVPNDETKIVPRNEIAFAEGTSYGFTLEIYGPKGVHQLKEEFILPGPGNWGSPPDADPSTTISEDATRMTRTMDVEFKEGIEYTMIYSVAPGDPKGIYRFRFFLDGELLDEGAITIK